MMEELQDAIEDAQYVNAINTQDDGPRPVLPWDSPSSVEELQRWASTKKWDVDHLLESPIAFFLFSSYLKTNHNDYLRINFCEDVIRFKKMRGKNRRKQAQYIMDEYMNSGPKQAKYNNNNKKKNEQEAAPKINGGYKVTSSILADLDASHHSSENGNNNNGGAAGGKLVDGTTITIPTLGRESTTGSETVGGKIVGGDGISDLPPRTEIEECDLGRKPLNSRSNAYLKEDASFRIYCDYPTCSKTKVGIRDAILDDLIDDWKEWEEQEKKITAAALAAATTTSVPMTSTLTTRQRSGDSFNSINKKGSNHSRSSPNHKNDEEDQPQEQQQQQEDAPDDEPVFQDEMLDAQPTPTVPSTEALESSESVRKNDGAVKNDGENGTTTTIGMKDDGSLNNNTSNHSKTSKTTTTATAVPTQVVMMERTVPGMSIEEYDAEIMNMRLLTQKFKGSKESLHDALFDKAETVVMESLRRQYWADFVQSREYQRCQNFLWYQDRPTVPDDFYIMRVLGRGGFGLVNACKKGTSGKLYAMKLMNKRRIKMKKSEQLAKNEREAMAAVESNFVVNLKYSFHSKDDVYLILDLMTGGDLGFHLHQKGRFPKREVQYYAARIMLGLQALHDKGYVYRDLKPENCLMGEDGRVKITDLGLATKITPTLHGAAGTRGYWAPEMLRRDKRGKRMPYGHTVDWFSFGCCVTEFICGANPFRSEAALNFGLAKGKQTKEKAIDCATLEMEPEFPREFFEPDARDLCTQLLQKNEKIRLGTFGCEEIMAHPYFKSVNWESVISDRKRPPYEPAKDVNAASQSEIGNFVEDKAYQETVLDDKDEAVYKSWAWTNPRAYATEVIEFLIYERETGEPLLPISQNAGCCCIVL